MRNEKILFISKHLVKLNAEKFSFQNVLELKSKNKIMGIISENATCSTLPLTGWKCWNKSLHDENSRYLDLHQLSNTPITTTPESDSVAHSKRMLTVQNYILRQGQLLKHACQTLLILAVSYAYISGHACRACYIHAGFLKFACSCITKGDAVCVC